MTFVSLRTSWRSSRTARSPARARPARVATRALAPDRAARGGRRAARSWSACRGAVRPTRSGSGCCPHARATVAAADEAHTAARAVGELRAGELRVGALLSVALGIVPATIRAWRTAHPAWRSSCSSTRASRRSRAAMLEGAADLAVGPPPPAGAARARDRDRGVRRRAAPRTTRCCGADAACRLAQLADRPWVLYAPEFGLSRWSSTPAPPPGSCRARPPRPPHGDRVELARRAWARRSCRATSSAPRVRGAGPPARSARDPRARRVHRAPSRRRTAAAFIDLLVAHATL